MYFRSVGTIAGIIIGSIIGLVIIITIIVAICATCTKTAGTRGRVIHTMNPSGVIAVLHSSTNGKYTNVWFTRACTHTNTQTQRIYIYITNLVCYTYFHCFLNPECQHILRIKFVSTYFHWFFNPECQHIFGKQTGYICTFSISLIWAPKNNNNVVDKNRNIYASLNQYHNTV